MAMLKALSKEKAREVIRLAEIANAAPRPKKSMLNDDGSLNRSYLDHTPEDQALLDYLDSLSTDELHELKALMWIGSEGEGMITLSYWNTQVQKMRNDSNRSIADYIFSKVRRLHIFVETGLTYIR